jgi:hypothetical protein
MQLNRQSTYKLLYNISYRAYIKHSWDLWSFYGSESWALTKTDENKLKIFERKIYVTISENGNWCSRYNRELYQLYEDGQRIKVIKAGRLRWLGHLYRANETDPCRKVTFTKIQGRRKKGRPPIRWLDSGEKDLRVLGIQGWRNKAQERNQWKSIVGEVKACNKL